MPGYTMQSRGTTRTPIPQERRLHLSAWQKSLLRLSQSGLGTQTANQPKFVLSIIILSHLALVFGKSVKALSLTLKSLALAYSIVRIKAFVMEPRDALKCRNG